MQKTIDFKIGIPCDTEKPDTIIWLKEKSSYNHNYFHIGNYGDCLYGELDTILQIYEEEYDCYTYQYGFFKNDKFVPMLCWTISEDIFEDVKR